MGPETMGPRDFGPKDNGPKRHWTQETLDPKTMITRDTWTHETQDPRDIGPMVTKTSNKWDIVPRKQRTEWLSFRLEYSIFLF